MASRIDADIDVQRFGFVSDEAGSRLVFPHAHAVAMEGKSGDANYGASKCTFTGLEGRLSTLRWKADAAVAEAAWLRDVQGRYELVADRIEHPRGIMLVRGADQAGVSRLELVAPEVTFSDLRVTVNGPFGANTKSSDNSAPTSRQRKLRFLDGLSGVLSGTVRVRLDLPVLGVRTLDQELRIPIQNGAIDFRALEDSLHWLGGAFLDIAHDNEQLKLCWKVPIVGPSYDLVTWPLDSDASALAVFGRVPVRSLTEPRLASASADAEAKDRRKILNALAIGNLDIAVSLVTPRSLELASGIIAFGTDQQPGLVDFKLAGALSDQGPGLLKGAIRSIDTTMKDVRIGPLEVTADRIELDGVDQIEIAFDGFRPTSITLLVRRAIATNLSLTIGR